MSVSIVERLRGGRIDRPLRAVPFLYGLTGTVIHVLDKFRGAKVQQHLWGLESHVMAISTEDHHR